jgi:hypothetical protein
VGDKLYYRGVLITVSYKFSPKHSVLLLTDLFKLLLTYENKFSPIYRMWTANQPEVHLLQPEDVEVRNSRKISAFFLFLLIFVTYFFISCDAIYLLNQDTQFSPYSDQAPGCTTNEECLEFQKGTAFTSLPRSVSIGSGVLPSSHSIGNWGLLPRTGSQTVQLQHSRAEVINDWSSNST